MCSVRAWTEGGLSQTTNRALVPTGGGPRRLGRERRETPSRALLGAASPQTRETGTKGGHSGAVLQTARRNAHRGRDGNYEGHQRSARQLALTLALGDAELGVQR